MMPWRIPGCNITWLLTLTPGNIEHNTTLELHQPHGMMPRPTMGKATLWLQLITKSNKGLLRTGSRKAGTDGLLERDNYHRSESSLSLEVTKIARPRCSSHSLPPSLPITSPESAGTGTNKILRPLRDCNAWHQGGWAGYLSNQLRLNSNELWWFYNYPIIRDLFKHLLWEQ